MYNFQAFRISMIGKITTNRKMLLIDIYRCDKNFWIVLHSS